MSQEITITGTERKPPSKALNIRIGAITIEGNGVRLGWVYVENGLVGEWMG